MRVVLQVGKVVSNGAVTFEAVLVGRSNVAYVGGDVLQMLHSSALPILHDSTIS